MVSTPALVFFTGLGADERLLEPQRALPFTLIVPRWIEPCATESLPVYAQRLAATVDWPARVVLGGVSFGGMVAAELTAELQPAGLVLLSSCRHVRTIPTVTRFINALTKAVEEIDDPSPVSFKRQFLNIFAEFDADIQVLMADMLQQTSLDMLRWVNQRILDWEEPPPPRCPSLWVHGAADPVIPLAKVRPDVVIPGGGHLVNWTHTALVNRTIREFVERL